MKCWCQISVRFTMDRLWFSCCPLSEDGPLFYPIKETVSRLCARTSVLFFFFLQKTIELSYSLDKIFFPDRTAEGDLLFIFSSNILDFRRSLSSYIIIWLAVRRLIAILSLAGPPRDPRTALSARIKNIFSNLKHVSEVNCSKSSNICQICSRPSLKRLKDINKNAISTL